MGRDKFLITCRFPSWGYSNNPEVKYPSFGVRYVMEAPPDFGEEELAQLFLEKWQEKIGKQKPFNGEILFIDKFDCTFLDYVI